MTVLRCLNQLGIVWSIRSEHGKSAEYLEKAENLCKKYRTEVGSTPLYIRDLFDVEENHHDEVSVALELVIVREDVYPHVILFSPGI